MRIRELALALPLAAGIACSTSSTQAPRTASRTTQTGAATTSDTRRSGDQVVGGVITGISAQSLTILTGDGTTRTLRLAPDTSVQVDGRDARASDLQEGQPVRATFSPAAGDDVAVTVDAGRG